MTLLLWTPNTSSIYPDFHQQIQDFTKGLTTKPLEFNDLRQAAKNDIILRDKLWLPNSKPLFPFQRVTLRAMHEASIVWLEAMRGSAKSYGDARYALLEGLENPIKVVCTGPTFRQALHPFNYIDVLIHENWDEELPLSLSREQDGQTVRGNMEAVIRLKNGTVFKALPMGNGERLRGERADILLCDEFFLMEREMFQSHIVPFLLGHREPGQIKKLIMSTSAEFEDSFAYSVLTKRILPNIVREDKLFQDDPNYKRTYALLSWDVDDLRAEGYNFGQDVLDLLLEGANQEERDQALYNKWRGVSGQFFPANLVDKMSDPRVSIEYLKDGQHEYGMTVDIARAKDGDDFIIHVFKFIPEWGNKMTFVNSYRNKGLSAAEMAWKIYQYDERFNPTWILMDKGGGGIFVRDELMKSKLEFQDGTVKDIKPKDFILEWNENRSIPGRKKLIFNRYSDEQVRAAFASDRSRGGEYIHNEDIMSHLLYDGLRQTLHLHDIPILIPATYSDEGDADNSEAEIFDRIRQSIQQLKLLRMDMKEDSEGNKIVVHSKVNNVPKYSWKHATKDGGVAFCYAYILFNLMYREDTAKHDIPQAITVPTIPNGLTELQGREQYSPGQFVNPFLN